MAHLRTDTKLIRNSEICTLTNTASHPKKLATLANQFVIHKNNRMLEILAYKSIQCNRKVDYQLCPNSLVVALDSDFPCP